MSGGQNTNSRRAWAGLSAIGFMLVICTFLGAGLGFAADKRLGTAPWFMIGGILFGLAAGLLYVVDKAWARQEPKP